MAAVFSAMTSSKMAASRGCKVLRGALLHTVPAAPPALPPSALYPPVVASLTAHSKASEARRREEAWRAVQAAGSVAERLRLLTKQQRRKYVLYPQSFAQHADRWHQHFTKSAFRAGLPARAGLELPEAELRALREEARDLLLQEAFYLRKRAPPLLRRQQVTAGPFLSGLVSAVRARLGLHNPLLLRSQLDLHPNVNFYWMRGETAITRGHRRGKVDPIRFQIDDTPHSQIRVPQQLPPFLPLDDPISEEVPIIRFGPDKLPLFKRQYENTIFIGAKVDDPCCYGHTQFHLVSDKNTRDRLLKANLADQIEVRLRAHAIASLFAWTGAQAMYQGFWSHSDVTRPFVSQSVISDGQYFSFFCYQLNTLALTVETDQNNPRRNICWGTESIPLYEAVEGSEVKGFNDDVLKLIVQFLLNRQTMTEC